MRSANPWLVAGGWLSLAAAAIHVGAIFGGAPWYRFFGAGEGMARAAARGDWRPPVFAACIAAGLTIWAAYAFSGAGLIGRLPLRRLALVVISAVYLARGLVLVRPSILQRPDLSYAFLLWSSAIVLLYGIVHAVGTWRGWNRL